jgi:uncharacterized transporter YbjL
MTRRVARSNVRAMTSTTWLTATVLGALLALLAFAVGGPSWAIVLGLVGGFLVVLLTVGLRE